VVKFWVLESQADHRQKNAETPIATDELFATVCSANIYAEMV